MKNLILYSVILLFTFNKTKAQVFFYNHCNYDGVIVAAFKSPNSPRVEKYDFGGRNKNYNKMLSSIKISRTRQDYFLKAGFIITLYEGANYTGDSIKIYNDISCLTLKNFNDRTSSIKVEKVYKGHKIGDVTPPVWLPNGSNTNNNSTQVNNYTHTTSGGVQYKLYIKPNSTNTYNGIILLGAGNNEQDPSTGSLSGGIENETCKKLAEAGYLAAIVAYKDQPPLKSDWSNWSSNCALLVSDFNEVANGPLAQEYRIPRNKIIFGGFSYAGFALLAHSQYNTNINDIKGILAICASTSVSQYSNIQLPIYNLLCAGNNEGQLNGATLINEIKNPTAKSISKFEIDNSCNTHCGGNQTEWANKIVTQVKQWLP